MPTKRRLPKSDTSQHILDVAQNLVQRVGYNAFSYADIAAAVHISKASLHYHFPTKAKLGHSLIARYEKDFRRLLAEIDARGQNAPAKLRDYVAIYARVLKDHRMCLCGMLAAEFETLPRPMQSALDHFFDLNEEWLEGVLQQGRAEGSLKVYGPPREQAQFIVAVLEGAMMLARSHGAERRFQTAARKLLADLGI